VAAELGSVAILQRTISLLTVELDYLRRCRHQVAPQRKTTQRSIVLPVEFNCLVMVISHVLKVRYMPMPDVGGTAFPGRHARLTRHVQHSQRQSMLKHIYVIRKASG